MQPGEPKISPVRVFQSARLDLPMPRSIKRARPSSPTMMFRGDRSRCTIPSGARVFASTAPCSASRPFSFGEAAREMDVAHRSRSERFEQLIGAESLHRSEAHVGGELEAEELVAVRFETERA